eukprot:scaffold255265_cov49-Tisochrysis_lutea.AAC.1
MHASVPWHMRDCVWTALHEHVLGMSSLCGVPAGIQSAAVTVSAHRAGGLAQTDHSLMMPWEWVGKGTSA